MKALRIHLKPTRHLGLLGLSVLTAGLSSCAHLNEDISGDPLLGAPPVQTAQANPPVQGAAKAIEGIPLPVNGDEGPVKANHWQVREVKTSSLLKPVSSNILAQASQAQPELCPPGQAAGEWSAPPCPICPPGQSPYGTMGFPIGSDSPASLMGVPVVPGWVNGAAIAPIAANFPDEYLCDGGDREYPVRYDADMRLGLDTEDTVAEYTDHTGESHLKPSNKICVYAPRFGAVRSISGPVEGTAVDKLASADAALLGAGVKRLDVTGLHNQNVMLGAYRTRERASDIDVDVRPSGLAGQQLLASHTKLINTFQDLQFVRIGVLAQTDEVRLAKGIQAAVTWTRSQFPVVVASLQQGQEVIGEFNAGELVGIEDKRTPGNLRIVKLADKAIAEPGDVITFTIRFDNIGERELTQIRIIDNLTPRLQYVEDSETSDRAGRLVLQDNEEGSMILEFHLDDPLPGGQGGVVTFQTKVR